MMNTQPSNRPVEVLLVEDDPGDAYLMMETMKESKLRINMHSVDDGVKAMAFLRREDPYQDAVTPDMILLDLNMPRKDGRQVLREIKSDETLKHLPVVILTTSQAEADVVESYSLGANCYVPKPVGLNEFVRVVKAIKDFWFTIVVGAGATFPLTAQTEEGN